MHIMTNGQSCRFFQGLFTSLLSLVIFWFVFVFDNHTNECKVMSQWLLFFHLHFSNG